MAGDWIKMRIDLQSHPKVVRILSATKSDKFRVVGGLHAVWAIFDTHSTDGVLSGYTPEVLDHIIGWDGFSQAMISVGWLVFDGEQTLAVPEFDEHNGKGGKRRAEDQKRKRISRNSPEVVHTLVRNSSAIVADKDRTKTGLEKRREEKKEQKKERGNPTAPSQGTRLPENWTLTADRVTLAKDADPRVDPRREAPKFRDYWLAATGKNAVKADWDATWRNWIRRAGESLGPAVAHAATIDSPAAMRPL